MPPGITPAARRSRRGRAAWHAGLAAEEIAARHYRARGASVRAQRRRTPEGEIDLIVEEAGQLVFVEVKRRASIDLDEDPVGDRQWRRLECAALHYMMEHQNETGVQPVCRFDVVLSGRDGRVRIIENARGFDEP